MKIGQFLFRHRRIKGPLSWIDHIPFVKYLIIQLKPNLIVELGTHTGNSFCGMLEAVEFARLNTKVFAVDTWEGDIHSGYYSEEVYTDLFKYVSSTYPSASLLKMNFNDALTNFEDKSIDLLHIDGLHTYEAVKRDFETWFPKMKDSGVILFHDTIVKDNNFGVYLFWEEISKKFICFNFEFGSGLGVLSISNDLNDPINVLLGKFINDPIYITLFEEFSYHRNCQDKIKLYENRITNLKKSRVINLWLILRDFLGLKKIDL